MLVDTHCHLGDRQFDDDRADAIARARAEGVHHVVVIADSAPASRRAIAIAREYRLSSTAGVHPHEASSWSATVESEVREALADPAVVAVGEAGLDYHYDFAPREAQRTAFAAQLDLGVAHGLPVVVHCREADEDMAAMLRGTRATVVLHSFNAGAAVFDAGLEIGAYFSWSGMVTFRTWTLADRLTACPPDRLLVETDAPYLAPVPFRGRRNEPAFVRQVAARVAELRGMAPDDVARRTTANAVQAFGNRLLDSSLGNGG